MQKREANDAVRGLWCLCIGLAALAPVRIGLLAIRLVPYVATKYWGAGADLHGVALPHASLGHADLASADLRGADLHGNDLRGTLLRGALYDQSTQWPAGFDTTRHGVVRTDEYWR
jgi:hypothetical protein